jgi:molecular chaperone GrpE
MSRDAGNEANEAVNREGEGHLVQKENGETTVESDNVLNATDQPGEAAALDTAAARAQIERLEQELAQAKEQMLRARADFENLRRRSRLEKEETLKQANAALIGDLLPVLDNFERALAADSSTAEALQQGVEMVFRQLNDTLQNHGLQEIAALGQPFDPNFHHAVMQEPSDQESGIILDVLQKGYTLNEKVIRPAMVKVSQ